MPIDIRLLRTSESAKQVEKWQKIRERDETSNTKLQEIIQLDQDCRDSLKDLTSYKSSCRQERKRQDPDILKSLQTKYDGLYKQLQLHLCTVANSVDETLLSEMETWQETERTRCNPNILRSPYRRLVELGAWEVLGNNLQSKTGMLYCTGLGNRWGIATSNFLRSSIQEQNIQQELLLPEFLGIDENDLHGMMGCTTKSCVVCDQGSASYEAEPWLGYLKLQYADQTLGDKQLPMSIVYTTRSRMDQSILNTSSVNDPREQLMRNSSDMMPPTAALLMDRTVHHALILTSSTYYDSRKVQTEWADRLVGFYQSLIPVDNNKELVRQRVLPPPELLLAEASRIVVEGYMPLPKDGEKKISAASNNQGHWIVLAYLSNFSDFPTRACRLKNNKQQFCHVVQGTLGSIPELMCWQANHGSNDGDLPLSMAFAKHFPEQTAGIIPQVKRFEATKNGRVILKSVPANKGDDVGEKAKLAGDISPSGFIQKERQRTNVQMLDVGSRATSEQIAAEAQSSPFSFLPFFHS